MMAEAAIFLRDEVRRFLVQRKVIGSPADVVLGNVATLDDNQGQLANKVVMTLVNVEEESTLKNGPYFIRNTATNVLETVSTPVYVNLYILFSATLPPMADDKAYEDALQRLTSIVELFQSKKTFTIQNTPGFRPGALNRAVLVELRLLPELYTLTFEQLNHLWGSLGGKQSPSIMYKIRLVKIENLITTESSVIETIENNARATEADVHVNDA